ncbi:MAG: Xaa-Pro aminopeptidase [Pyrinomonadaceae bacterium MAG19_C2-C3]|nr:Xaa-Pro aminopeptidase [Pyrinomonadaceae bacterium MAG19_C2-C3]
MRRSFFTSTLNTITATLMSLALLTGTIISPVTANETRKSAPAIRLTPPAPVITDAERVGELASRRGRIASAMEANRMLVLFAAAPRIYTNDVDYEYRQENNFYYLTNLRQENARLVMFKAAANAQPTTILFLPRRNPARETWTGYMYSPEDARRVSGISDIRDVREFPAFVRAFGEGVTYNAPPESMLTKTEDAVATNKTNENLRALFAARAAKQARLLMLAPRADARDEAREWRQEAGFANEWEKTNKDVAIESAFPIFAQARLIKSPMEQRFLQHAVDITTEALGRAMGAAHNLKHEYEAEAEVEYTFKRRGADYWGYPSIVGCGANATTLHYWESRGEIKRDDLLLMDVGAEYDHYTADVTRTFPVSGKFNAAQAEIYNLVFAAQEAGIKAITPQATFKEINEAANNVMREGLFKLGLTTDRESNQFKLWSIHGTSHWLGMNVHDVGGAQPLMRGTVFTVEPGIYIRPDALDNLPDTPETRKFIAAVRPAFEKYKSIGVRIEDDVLITETGYRNLSEKLPRTLADVENFMARAQREFQATRRDSDVWKPVLTMQGAGDFDGSLAQSIEARFDAGRTVRRGFVRSHTARTMNHSHAHHHVDAE